jgi:glycosyltransferase involved in cell wall biosynthesis
VRVLVVIDSLGVGTTAKILSTLAKVAPAEAIQLQLASLQFAPGTSGTSVRDLDELGIKPNFIGVRGLLDLRAVQRIADVIRRSRCDIVHAHLSNSSTLVPMAARLAGRPSVCSLYSLPRQGGGRELLKERLCVATAGRSSALIFESEAALEQFAARYPRRHSWRILRTGIDAERWSPGAGRFPPELRIPAGASVTTIVGALRATKGHALAIAAWRSVLSHLPEARLVIVGDGPEKATLRRQVERVGLHDHVLFVGRIDDEQETVNIVRASDLVLLPSYREALPMALIEASACGRPVVATDVGGVREVVSEGVNGTLIAPGQIAAISDAVIDLLEDRERRARMGHAGRMIAEERFGMHRWARRLRDIYAEAAASVDWHSINSASDYRSGRRDL